MLVQRYPRFRRRLRRWLKRSTLATIILLLCCYIYGTKIEPNWIEVVPIELTLTNLDPAFNNFKIVQISDLHVSKFMPKARLAKIVRLVNQQNADAIAITGDIVTKRSHFDAIELQQYLSQLKATSGIVAVLGNHEHWIGNLDLLEEVLAQSQIDNLHNEVYTIERDGHQLAFAGIDDPYWGQPDLDRVIHYLPEGVPAIFLVHEPDYIETSAATHKFALQLSGHSHGGQVRIPYFTPLVLPIGGRKYFAGLERVEDTFTYTNRGLGMTNLAIRIGSRPEITVFSLYSPA